ncbi:MAG: DUF434 domain-containing protein [Desulfurococcaceae archaeon]|nr:DUF434 domain-containing protein [Desulfurococcaceae archaeon]
MHVPLRTEVREAARDYRYLLDRGYPQKASLDLVSSRYGLERDERALLLRCIHRGSDAASVRSKTVRAVTGESLVVDGYNVVLTVASAIEGRQLFLCDDGFVRDLRSSYTKDFESPSVVLSLELVARSLRDLKPAEVLIVLDKNVSWSSRHAEFIRGRYGLETVLAARADVEVIGSGRVVCSSDFVILTKAARVFDLAQHVIRSLLPHVEFIDISSLLESTPSGLPNEFT